MLFTNLIMSFLAKRRYWIHPGENGDLGGQGYFTLCSLLLPFWLDDSLYLLAYALFFCNGM